MEAHSNLAMAPRAGLAGQRFEVAVIGGGISGVAIARECALARKRTLLVEQHDFAAGTTSRSTRIIHGGLRYLEHGDIVQVRESLKERGRLLKQHPEIVRPLEFLLALDGSSQRSALAIRMGLWLYRTMGSPKLHARDENQRYKLERLLDSGRRFSLFCFEDAQCEFPERLVAEWLGDAMEAGCVARNHAQVLTVTVQDGIATGLLLRDRINGVEERIESDWIINATGPWADQVCQAAAIRPDGPMVRGVRGSHIVLPRFQGMPNAAVYTEAVDGRPVFVIPWNEQVLVGTTEVPDGADPALVRPDEAEIDYLLRSLHGLFPQLGVTRQDVRYAFAGVRPLPYSRDADVSGQTRRHCLYDHAEDGASRMISVIGGKLTTAGWVARECAIKIGIARGHTPKIAVAEESGLEELLERSVTEVAEAGQFSRESARAMVDWHGKRSSAIARSLRDREDLKARLCPHSDHVVGEALHAFSHECAVTLGDVLLRRVPVALGGCWSTECSRMAAASIGAVAGWDENRQRLEVEMFEAEREAFLHKPQAASTGA